MAKCGNDPMLQRGLDEAEKTRETASSFANIFRIPDIDIVNSTPSLAYLRQDTEFMDLLRRAETDSSVKESLTKDPRYTAILYARLAQIDPKFASSIPQTAPSSQPSPPSSSSSPKPSSTASSASPKPAKEPVPELSEKEKEVQSLKEAGNALYKKKDLEGALAKYQAALEVDPQNVTVRNNVSAVLLEQGKLDECVAYCNETVEIARAVHAKYEDVARAYIRIGNAELKRENYEAAKEAFLSSRTESPLKGVEDKIRQCDRLLEEAKKRAYLNPEEVFPRFSVDRRPSRRRSAGTRCSCRAISPRPSGSTTRRSVATRATRRSTATARRR